MTPSAHAQRDSEPMRQIEHAVAGNLQDLVAAYRVVAPGAGAACIEVAGGVAGYTGIGSPLTTVKGTTSHLSPRDLDAIESFFEDRHATATIETAPWLSEESAHALRDRGYGVVGREDVVATISGAGLPAPVLRVEAVPSHAWAEIQRRGSEWPEDGPVEDLVIAASRLPRAQLYGVSDKGRWIACAQSVSYMGVVIFGNDATLPDARRRGAQTALIQERLRALPAGTIAMAEVAPASGSERNYLRCGFRIAYTRLHYARIA
jgi:hypothetical protein